MEHISVNYHANSDAHFRVVVEAIAPHKYVDEPYYRMRLGIDTVTVYLSDADCRAIMDALGSRPPLAKSDAEIDAAREPLRSVVNAISGGEDAPF